MNYLQFEQWYTLSGYVLLAVAGLGLPLFWLHGPPDQKSRRWIIMGIAVVALISLLVPFLVVLPVDETDSDSQKLLSRSGRIVQLYTFLLFFAAFAHRAYLLPTLRYFFWLTYSLALFGVFDSILLDVIFVTKYGFYNKVAPILKYFDIREMGFLSPISYLIKFIFLGLLFRDILGGTTTKRVFWYITWGLVVFELVQVFVFKSFQGYDSLSSTVKNIFIITACGIFLSRFYQTTTVGIPLQRNPFFWIILGLLLTALGDIFMEFIFQKLYQTDTSVFYSLYLIRNASQIVGFWLMTIGVFQAKNLRYLPASY